MSARIVAETAMLNPRTLGTTLIVAPHPDDESIGCGGLIALLRAQPAAVHVVFLSNGDGSHPQSRRYPPERIAIVREREALAALARLGVNAASATFLRYPDRGVPGPTDAAFAEAVRHLRMLVESSACQTVVTPWRRDPHCDHRAATEIVQAALHAIAPVRRLLEYPVWLDVFGDDADRPRHNIVRWRLDIQRVRHCKAAAIAEHRSQTTNMIDDDATGFRLSADVLRRFTAGDEYYFEELG